MAVSCHIGVVYIMFIGAHGEYDRADAETLEMEQQIWKSARFTTNSTTKKPSTSYRPWSTPTQLPARRKGTGSKSSPS
ncbi:hypothetical protein [Burkholderia pseudomallei]|uniref:hypothetical protein n=1 Tax=Burkholderia pseudomallei TaxID=28450 RepID=UPI001EFA707D|nr:hypothetical protein [Burkholderia pseudomallei]